jgi:DNA-binding HxlR family transcriptional regulator
MDFLNQLNSAFDHRNRLGIMSVLMVNDWVDYTSLKSTLELTDGNLASHLRALENIEFVEIRKQFNGRKPQTTYKISEKGRKAFISHLDGLEQLLKIKK